MAWMDVMFILRPLLCVQHPHQMKARNSHLCLISTFALPHLMFQLNYYFLMIFPTPYCITSWSFLLYLQRMAYFELLDDFM